MENTNNEMCSHGCGQIAKYYSKETRNWRCEKSSNGCPKIKEKLKKIRKIKLLEDSEKLKFQQIKEKYKDEKFGQQHLYDRVCIQCSSTFKVFIRPSQIGNKDYDKKCCSSTCARTYSSNIKRKEINKKLTGKMSSITKKAHREGKITHGGGNTKWLQYKGFKVQGSYELRTCFILDRMKEQALIHDWEYTKDRFQYIGMDGKQHTYLQDFKIFNKDGSFYYLETKGYPTENDLLKWMSVVEQGYRLDVWFLKDIVEREH